jgi:hypothetical protein
MIALTSYNGTKEKGVAHTRPKPALSVAKLISMGDSKLWKMSSSLSAADNAPIKTKELEAKVSPKPTGK